MMVSLVVGRNVWTIIWLLITFTTGVRLKFGVCIVVSVLGIILRYYDVHYPLGCLMCSTVSFMKRTSPISDEKGHTTGSSGIAQL